MSRHQTRIVAARALRDRLKAEGRNDDARIVDDLCRSSAMSAGLNKSLQRQLGDIIAGAKEAAPAEPVIVQGRPDPVIVPAFFERPTPEFELEDAEEGLASAVPAIPPFGPGRWA